MEYLETVNNVEIYKLKTNSETNYYCVEEALAESCREQDMMITEELSFFKGSKKSAYMYASVSQSI